MALSKVKGTLERVLDKNLQDLVRGIRNHKENETKYVAECLDEIKNELRQENVAVKAIAVNKLTYLQMLGYDISWAAFNVIEVMSSPKFTFKRIGYLSASQSFHEGTDVLMLTTNMIRKDLGSQNLYDAGVALNGLSCFITADLARDLANDIMTLMTSTKPYLRKKAVLIMYKVFLQFPEALRPAFPRLKEKLEDPDPGVQSAAVNVICELARKNPRNYLALAPLFFKLMTSSTNNWVLIKIIKLFGALTPLEPRLGKKLIEPLTNLIHSTSAMSLLYECINTVIAVLISVSTGIPNHTASIQLCVQKLRILIEDSDQNLKYLGLLAMSKILQTHPKSVQTHKDLILQCLDDKDESIRFRALDLLYGMVSKKNLMEIVKKLMVHMDKAEGTNYRDELLAKIIEICSQSNYQYVTNFEWYVSVLVELTRMEGTRHGRLIAAQMLDVAIRVQAIRPFAVAQMAVLLENAHVLSNNSQRNGICEVLYAAAWLCGEFPDHLTDPKGVLEAMLKPKITLLPGHIQSVYVQNIIKLYANIIKRAEGQNGLAGVREVGEMLQEKLPIFIQSADLEVQERACCMVQLVKYVLKSQDKDGDTAAAIAEELAALFAGDLNPVAPKAQKKVPVPEGLDLDAWINDPPSESSEDEDRPVGSSIFVTKDNNEGSFYHEAAKAKVPDMTPEERTKAKEQRRVDQAHNPNYLKGDVKKSASNTSADGNLGNSVVELDLSIPLRVPGGIQVAGLSSSDQYMKMEQSLRTKKAGKKKRKKRKKGGNDESDEEEDIPQIHQVSTVEEVPEGAEAMSDKEEDGGDERYKKLDIDLDEPLRPGEILPVRTHRIVPDHKLPEPEEEPKEKKKHKKKEKESKKDKKKSRDSRKEEREKRKRKKQSIPGEADEPSLLKEDHEEIAGDNTPLSSPRDKDMPSGGATATNSTDKMNDYEFWMSSTDAQSPSHSEPQGKPTTEVKVTPVQDITSGDEAKVDTTAHSKKKKKEKKERREKKEKKSKKSKLKAGDYEEAGGITTPSQEVVDPSQLETPVTAKPMSSYRLLAENASIKMMYETRVSPQRGDQLILSVVFTNLTPHLVNNLEFNVMDTLNTKLSRGMGQASHDAVQVPFVLPAGLSNEGQFAFSVDSLVQPTKLRGTLTYMVKMAEGSTHEKVDFRLTFNCSSFMSALPCKSSEFASLLSSGDLTEKSTMKCTPLENSFDVSLLRICFYNHFKVVEKVEGSASLYGRSIQGHHLCLLVKYNNGEITVDGKSAEGALLSNVLADIKTVLTSDVL
ncbi:AP-3 complex subunit delta-1-like isoform X1 [Dreissena polymorpha]|uniref:AP-3 complex subunit delta-1-like isoform X1 n=1 Tax=Dreissena polymorpha TaxID=45954 RepID=UPI002264C835|nr:AP-3 complex subunit delta-1-like isoform X1 [Dreissena polymorpha]